MKYLVLFSLYVSLSVLNLQGQPDTGSVFQDSNPLVFFKNTVQFNEAFMTALEKFPELSGSHIEVRRQHIFTMMAARPSRGFIFHSQEKRNYVILITNKQDMNADSIYSLVDQDAIVGLFGHELSHLLEYSDKSNAQMVVFGLTYFFNCKNIEQRTDRMAIERGFGNNLVKYNEFIGGCKHTNKRYLHRKQKYYLSQGEIENTIKKQVL